MSQDEPTYGKEILGDEGGPEPMDMPENVTTIHSVESADTKQADEKQDTTTDTTSDTTDTKREENKQDAKLEEPKLEPGPPGEERVTLTFRGRQLSMTGVALRSFLLTANFVLLIFALGVLIGAGYNSTAHVFALLETWFTPALVLGFFLLLIALMGSLGAISQSRVLLWLYVILLFLVGLVIMIVSSYALSMTRDGTRFLMNAWDVTPAPIRSNVQKTFNCCGLFMYLDTRAVLPCPDGSGDANSTYTPAVPANATGLACMQPMVEQFNRYSTGVPSVGLVITFMMWGIALITWQLIRAIASSIRESSFENIT
jgi:hypothetical protein